MSPLRDPSMPQAAAVLGGLGVVPFLGLAVQLSTGMPLGPQYSAQALHALLTYGAIILSFLGGIQWGLAVANADRSDAWRRYGLSIAPAIVAWSAQWVGGRNGLITLTAAFAVWAAYDLWSTGLGEAPSWYGRLRIILSTIVVASLAATVHYGQL